MSHPAAVQAAESKILQLTVARSLSFSFPDTLISNDPERIRSFFETHQGAVIAKPLRMGYFDYGHEQRATYTTALTADDLTDDGALAAAPVIYQKLIPKQCDIRITVVGDRVFGAAIDSQPTASARIDWRRADVELPHHVHDLPEGVQEACLQLMRRLGLVFGALDFVLTPDGEYVFLEVNASGQWLWLEDKLGFPIAREIACWLLRGASE